MWQESYVEMGWSLAIPLISWQKITVVPLMLVGMWLSVVHYGGRLSSISVCKYVRNILYCLSRYCSTCLHINVNFVPHDAMQWNTSLTLSSSA